MGKQNMFYLLDKGLSIFLPDAFVPENMKYLCQNSKNSYHSLTFLCAEKKLFFQNFLCFYYFLLTFSLTQRRQQKGKRCD